MPNKNYIKGKRFEYKTLADLRSKGWFAISQPKSQFPDIIAIKKAHIHYSVVRLIECKCKKKYMSKKERIELIELANKTNGLPILAYPEKVGRKIVIHYDLVVI